MKSFQTRLSRFCRKSIVLADYLLWSIFDFSKFKIVKKEKIKKVLLIHLGAMGELIVATPLLPPIKKELGAEVHFMVAKGKEDVLAGNSNIDKILTYKDSYAANFDILKKEHYDLAVILWPCFPKISYMCKKAGIPYRIGGFKSIRDGISFFFTRRSLDLKNNHAVQANLDIIRLIGLDNKNPKLQFFTNSSSKDKVDSFIKKNKIKKYAIIHPGFSFSASTKYPSRWWPAERYAEVADYLTSKLKMKVLITGNDGEKKFAEDIINKCKNKKDILVTNNLFNLNELATLVRSADLLLAPGTGIIHLACCFDTKIIMLAGKESPAEWHPWTKKENYRLPFHNEVCTECDKNYCRKKTQECMLAITSEEVINAAEQLLK